MAMAYNLRSSQRKKAISSRNCYLKNHINSIPDTFNPKVCLERMDLLDCGNLQNCRFYIGKDRITIKQDRPVVSNKKCFFKFCSIVLLALCLIYYKDEMQLYGIHIAKNITKLYPLIQNCYFHAIRVHRSNFKSLMHKIQNISNDKSEGMQDFILKSTDEDLDILKLVRDNFLELKDKNKFETPIKISESFIERQCKVDVKDSLKIFFDETNMTDYALESLGAEIVTAFNTESYGIKTVKFLNFNIWPPIGSFLIKRSKYFSTNGPNSILVPWKKPGDCWAFKGSHGRVQIKLSEKIFITAVTVDHLPRKSISDRNFASAPKKFSLLGVEDPGVLTDRKYLGTYEYKSAGPASQTFLLQSKVKIPLRWIEISIESNHGNENYTCIYKIRVHGHK